MAIDRFDMKSFVKDLKDKKEELKEVSSFRLRVDLMDEFRKFCEKENLSMSSVIEEFLKRLLNKK